MWPILLILDPVGNGGPGGEDGVWEKEDGAQRNLFGKSCIEPAGKFEAGAKCEGWRVAEEIGVVGSRQGHGSTYFIRWSRPGKTQTGVNEENHRKEVSMDLNGLTCGSSQASPQMPHLPRLVCHCRVNPPQ